VQIEGLKKLLSTLEKLAVQGSDGNAVVAVGYQTNYALHVHERRGMKWRGFPRDMSVRKKGEYAITGYEEGEKKGLFWGPNGRAGFLLDVAREEASNIAAIVEKAVKNGAHISRALLIAGLYLQRVSQKNVPVDTGTLKNSAFTVLEPKK